ncbi:MAG: cation:proton antiporter, partial [Bacteroidales bacterium]|nr:cation:proton antiporter [Bacteroidales bacterium]
MTLKTKSWLFFALLLIVFVISGYWLVKSGNAYNVVSVSSTADTAESDWLLFLHTVNQNIAEPFAILLLQLIAILIAVRIVGFLFVKIGQPTVIGEIIAGIILGPSLLGYFFPDVFNFLFPDDSMRNLEILSQIGLIFFMFVIGMELELNEIKKKANETFIISQTSIIVPFFFGMLLAYFVYQHYAVQHTFLPFALFIGISMSITAFPVLARIVQEKSLTKTHLGVVAIASAASNDVTAWCLLAVVIAIAKTGTIFSALSTIGLSITYVLFMLLVVRPFLQKLGHIYQNKEVVNKSIVAFIFLILILSASATQIIGIHALFGAFLAGVIMPVNLNFRKILTEKIEDLTLVLLLPLFFVFTGLRTKIGLLNTPELWALCIVFIVVGIAGKLIGTAAAARINGESWHNSLSLGALMNARGLMELIVLNIGYEMNILPPTIFVILVLMALITTFMTAPTLNLLNRLFPVSEKWEDTYAIRRKKYKILL